MPPRKRKPSVRGHPARPPRPDSLPQHHGEGDISNSSEDATDCGNSPISGTSLPNRVISRLQSQQSSSSASFSTAPHGGPGPGPRCSPSAHSASEEPPAKRPRTASPTITWENWREYLHSRPSSPERLNGDVQLDVMLPWAMDSPPGIPTLDDIEGHWPGSMEDGLKKRAFAAPDGVDWASSDSGKGDDNDDDQMDVDETSEAKSWSRLNHFSNLAMRGQKQDTHPAPSPGLEDPNNSGNPMISDDKMASWESPMNDNSQTIMSSRPIKDNSPLGRSPFSKGLDSGQYCPTEGHQGPQHRPIPDVVIMTPKCEKPLSLSPRSLACLIQDMPVFQVVMSMTPKSKRHGSTSTQQGPVSSFQRPGEGNWLRQLQEAAGNPGPQTYQWILQNIGDIRRQMTSGYVHDLTDQNLEALMKTVRMVLPILNDKRKRLQADDQPLPLADQETGQVLYMVYDEVRRRLDKQKHQQSIPASSSPSRSSRK
ncbi:hypothetical protein NEOLEDRAFT_1184877 [Neolentinus lepideus HHB14362 ss-1]|uniref:Uncharacterized protein n=1 Tax=Neolentinus lepideus HHB14362 ss-1 TaxID=1314782 RepID=A0A165KIL2_9AGAM|nr:hypothetical protein NEOLEDRAFT_1184877 [Neolentinus lepideus HHB14362 ss-1]